MKDKRRVETSVERADRLMREEGLAVQSATRRSGMKPRTYFGEKKRAGQQPKNRDDGRDIVREMGNARLVEDAGMKIIGSGRGFVDIIVPRPTPRDETEIVVGILLKIDELVAGGMSEESACMKIGVEPGTVRSWRKLVEPEKIFVPEPKPEPKPEPAKTIVSASPKTAPVQRTIRRPHRHNYTDDDRRRICESIIARIKRSNEPIRDIYAAHGISDQAFADWCRKLGIERPKTKGGWRVKTRKKSIGVVAVPLKSESWFVRVLRWLIARGTR